MNTPSAALGDLLWPSIAPTPGQAFEALPVAGFGRELLQHRRLFAQLEALHRPLEDAVVLTADLLSHGARLVVLGHGACQQVAALLAAELNRRARRWVPAAARRTDSTTIAVTVDGGATGFVERMGREGDVALWLAPHGDSESLLRAVATAQRVGMANLAIVGIGEGAAGALRDQVDICLAVPHDNPMRVHEAQLFLGNALVRQVDAALRPAAHPG